MVVMGMVDDSTARVFRQAQRLLERAVDAGKISDDPEAYTLSASLLLATATAYMTKDQVRELNAELDRLLDRFGPSDPELN